MLSIFSDRIPPFFFNVIKIQTIIVKIVFLAINIYYCFHIQYQYMTFNFLLKSLIKIQIKVLWLPWLQVTGPIHGDRRTDCSVIFILFYT